MDDPQAQPPHGRRRGDRELDAQIDHLAAAMRNISTAEILWGGPRGDGLVHTVARLSESVETLSKTVTTLAGEVTGADGLQAQFEVLKAKLALIERIGWWLAGIAALILVPGVVWLVGRSVEIALQGHA